MSLQWGKKYSMKISNRSERLPLMSYRNNKITEHTEINVWTARSARTALVNYSPCVGLLIDD